MRDLHRVTDAPDLPRARRFAKRWEADYPKAVACLRNDLDELLTCWRYPTLAERKRVRTTNAIERRFRKSGAGPGPWASSSTAPA